MLLLYKLEVNAKYYNQRGHHVQSNTYNLYHCG